MPEAEKDALQPSEFGWLGRITRARMLARLDAKIGEREQSSRPACSQCGYGADLCEESGCGGDSRG